MKPLGSIAALLAAVRDDAAAEVEAIVQEAEATVARVTGDDSSCPPPDAGARAVAAARARARVSISQEDWDDAREAIAEREQWIARAIELGAAQLRERVPADQARAELSALAREAIARLPPGDIEIVVSDADAMLLDRDWCAALIAPADPDRVRVVAGPIAAGCLARSASGRASFDNSYGARAERLQAVWRAELAELYERATSQLSSGQRQEPT